MSLKKDLEGKNLTEIKQYLENNDFNDTLINDTYFDFVEGKEIEDICV